MNDDAFIRTTPHSPSRPIAFGRRLTIDNNRQRIGKYRDALVVTDRGDGQSLRRSVERPPRPRRETRTPGRQAFNAGGASTPTFTEPPSRGYNPFS